MKPSHAILVSIIVVGLAILFAWFVWAKAMNRELRAERVEMVARSNRREGGDEGAAETGGAKGESVGK